MKCCRLCCNKYETLRESHIVSKMFYNAIKKNSITGIMRQASEPNVGVQDGLKIPLLCGNCEELFSKYETRFSNEVYTQTIKNNGEIQFDSRQDYISYFLLSIAWRVIVYTMENGEELTFTDKEKEKINEIIDAWRTILLTENMNEIRKVQQFIIPTKELKFFHNISLRVHDNVMMDFKTFDEKDTFNFAFTIVQIPYFIFITTVWGKSDSMKQYQVGKRIKVCSSRLPKNIEETLRQSHYDQFFEADKKLSDNQRELIEKRVKKKLSQKQ